ncbi:MAG: hypothetical protein J7L15_04255 [Clostridiales bacterium]|nr:hypothetical protein [Clostridiales bacterium]
MRYYFTQEQFDFLLQLDKKMWEEDGRTLIRDDELTFPADLTYLTVLGIVRDYHNHYYSITSFGNDILSQRESTPVWIEIEENKLTKVSSIKFPSFGQELPELLKEAEKDNGISMNIEL